MALLSQMIRHVAITGRTDDLNAWFATRQGGRWAEQTVRDAFPQAQGSARAAAAKPPADPSETRRQLNDLRRRGLVSAAEFEHSQRRPPTRPSGEVLTVTTVSGISVAVTGGAHGIGRAIAEHFARAGARVAVGDIDAGAAESLAAGIGGGAIGSALDVTDQDAFATFLDTAEESHGALGVLINNAGIDWIGPFHEEPDDVSNRQLDVNLMGTIIGSRLALQRMLPRRSGHLVNIASGVGRVPLPGSAVYSATKHGIVGLTESLRLEYRGSGIAFSVVHPAQVETAMLDGQGRPPLLPRVTPDDVAAAVLNAVRREKFEVWVPSSQAIAFRVGTCCPGSSGKASCGGPGSDRIAGETDQGARRGYHERMFGRS